MSVEGQQYGGGVDLSTTRAHIFVLEQYKRGLEENARLNKADQSLLELLVFETLRVCRDFNRKDVTPYIRWFAEYQRKRAMKECGTHGNS